MFYDLEHYFKFQTCLSIHISVITSVCVLEMLLNGLKEKVWLDFFSLCNVILFCLAEGAKKHLLRRYFLAACNFIRLYYLVMSDHPILFRAKMAPQLKMPRTAKMAPRCILALSKMAPRCILAVSKMAPRCI